VPDDYVFRGFSKPTFTQVPDEVFDELMPRLSGSEFKVLMYIVRRTFGFKKDSDSISLTQMTDGIKTRDGRQLDHGAGLARSTAVAALNGLIEKGVISAIRNQSEERGFEATTYTLHWADEPWSENRTSLVQKSAQPLVRESNPQETVDQHTDDNSSKGPEPVPMVSSRDRRMIESYLEDYARELNDQAPLASTLTRTIRLYASSGLELDDFLRAMQTARETTQRNSGNIRKEAPAGSMTKPKMPYFLSVLEALVTE
jgi:hypothetical protein